MQANIISQNWLPVSGAPYTEYDFTVEITDDENTTKSYSHILSAVELALLNAGTLTIQQIATAFAVQLLAELEATEAKDEKPPAQGSNTSVIPLVLGALTALVIIGGIGVFAYQKVHAHRSEHQYHCADFKTWSDADAAYNAGATYLDANHDGIPCEELYKKSHH